MKRAPAIGFPYRTSRVLFAVTVVVAALAVIATWVSAAPYWARIAGTLAIVGYAGTALGRLLRPRVCRLLWRRDGAVELTVRDAAPEKRRETQGAVAAARLMGPLIVLTLRWAPRGCANLWLLPDNLDADTRRRLRMRLRSGAGPGLASGNADNG